MFRFEGKRALIAGGGSGMGHEIARRLDAAGAHVAIADIKPDADLSEFDRMPIYLQGDLSDNSFVEEAVDQAAAELGGLDYLVNTAGVLWFDRDQSFQVTDPEVWDKVFAINVKSFALTSRHAVRHMERSGGGAMVHFSSTDALSGDPSPQDAYGASKAAVLRLSKSIAVQLASKGIRSNAVLPGLTMTPMQQRFEGKDAVVDGISQSIPLGRFGTADDQANACLFLLSDLSSYITGAELIVDGGSAALPS
ncbi:MAG: SDR family oxidoreductase [Pseudomonadota bacterium]